MKKVKIDSENIKNNKEINIIADYFKKGRVIVYPTDTIYGIGCLATNRKAIKRIYKIKRREKRKALLILVDSLAMVKKYCIINKEQEEFLRKVCLVKTLGALLRHRVSSAGPVTVILKSKGILPKKLVGERNGLAVRLPRNEFLIKIIGKVGAPIVSTSANISGEKNLTSVKNAEEYFKSPRTPILGGEIDLPDLVVDAGKLQNKPSRIVDIRNIRNIKILRK